MAIDYRLDAYLTIERVMLELDARGDPAADAIRDIMDPIWYSLSPDELSFLDGRDITHRLNPVTLSIEGLFLPESKNEDGAWVEIHALEVGKRFPLMEVLAA
jgi:hypothetical protein